MISERAAQWLMRAAADSILGSTEAFREVLDELAVAVYSTDSEGTLTYFNPACVRLAGRTPQVGTDKWCVTWKLYTTAGEHLPHDACPMAVAIRERRALHGAQAIAERPDGTRVNFIAFPTPVFDADGQLARVFNLLLDNAGRSRLDHATDALASGHADQRTDASIEMLARMAARLAGKKPDGVTTIKFGDVVAFDDVTWRYHDFLLRAEAAYRLLESSNYPK